MGNSILNEAWRECYDRGPVKLDNTLCRGVCTLNTWTDEKKAKVRALLEEGYYVHMFSDCIGHTLASMVETEGIRWVVEEYGLNVMIRKRAEYGDYYVALR